MRPHPFLLIGVGVIVALLAGCRGNDNANGNAPGDEASPSASTASSAATSFAPEPSMSESPAMATSSSIAEQSPSPSSEDPLARYVDAIPGDYQAEDVLFGEVTDLDLDGYPETVVALGEAGEVSAFYVLRDVGGEVMRIGDNLAEDGYLTSEAKLIRLQGYAKPILYAGLTNGGGLNGFRLFEMNGGKPSELLYSASVTGAGGDELLDNDGDGQYDGYVQHRYSYDELYYNVRRTFAWNAAKGTFEPQRTFIALEETYPEDVESVVYQYLSLHVIDDGYSDELTARLNELCADPEANELSIDWELWRIALFDAIMEIGGSYSLDVEEKGDQATAVAVGRAENKSAAISFQLTKMHDQWTITKIG